MSASVTRLELDLDCQRTRCVQDDPGRATEVVGRLMVAEETVVEARVAAEMTPAKVWLVQVLLLKPSRIFASLGTCFGGVACGHVMQRRCVGRP